MLFRPSNKSIEWEPYLLDTAKVAGILPSQPTDMVKLNEWDRMQVEYVTKRIRGKVEEASKALAPFNIDVEVVKIDQTP